MSPGCRGNAHIPTHVLCEARFNLTRTLLDAPRYSQNLCELLAVLHLERTAHPRQVLYEGNGANCSLCRRNKTEAPNGDQGLVLIAVLLRTCDSGWIGKSLVELSVAEIKILVHFGGQCALAAGNTPTTEVDVR